MAKKRIYIINCSVCGEPGGTSVPCGYCKENSGDGNTKQSHSLCDKCFLLGCPAKNAVDLIFPHKKEKSWNY